MIRAHYGVISLALLADKDFLDPIDDTANAAHEVHKSRNDRRSCKWNRTLVEQYQQGQASLICDLAILQVIKRVSSSASPCDNPPSHQVLASLVFNADVVNAIDLHHWQQEPVLVENVETVQGPNGVIPSVVRLYPIHDETSDCLGGLCYLAAINGGLKFLPIFPDRKSSVVVRATESSNYDFVDNKIKSSL